MTSNQKTSRAPNSVKEVTVQTNVSISLKMRKKLVVGTNDFHVRT